MLGVGLGTHIIAGDDHMGIRPMVLRRMHESVEIPFWERFVPSTPLLFDRQWQTFFDIFLFWVREQTLVDRVHWRFVRSFVKRFILAMKIDIDGTHGNTFLQHVLGSVLPRKIPKHLMVCFFRVLSRFRWR